MKLLFFISVFILDNYNYRNYFGVYEILQNRLRCEKNNPKKIVKVFINHAKYKIKYHCNSKTKWRSRFDWNVPTITISGLIFDDVYRTSKHFPPSIAVIARHRRAFKINLKPRLFTLVYLAKRIAISLGIIYKAVYMSLYR